MRKRLSSLSILILSGFLIGVGSAIVSGGPSPAAISADPAIESLKSVARVMERIEGNPSVTMESRDLIYAGIHGMFRTLDPYTQFLDEDAFDYMRAQQQGSFFGIGISFDIRDGELLVISPIEESPAWRLGIRAGDIIEEIDGETVAGITSNEVIKRLRGEKGSIVRLGIRRQNVTGLVHHEVVRDKITLNSARGGFMIGPETGYVRLTEFSATTYLEMMEKLAALEAQGMQRLVLDLRFNGGGLLSAAEQIASTFLHQGQTIVSTKGRATDTAMEINCRKDGEYRDLSLIILVNDSSASASEIVAGAIQDHDRGLVIGTATHGKGLVGSQFQTRLETAAQITTAQYFTPSGRFIQRPFDIPHRKKEHADLTVSDLSTQEHRTDQGRQVFERGGITPDVIVEEPILSPLMYRMELQRVFFDFVVNHRNEMGNIDTTFEVSDSLLDQFVKKAISKDPALDPASLVNEKTQLRSALRREIFAVYINSDAADKIRVMELNAIKEALKLFPQIDSIIKSATSETKQSEVSKTEPLSQHF